MQVADDTEYAYNPGRIDRLEVENFKSYRGYQLIGPFKRFTAVIGPNGSGKSNLMDAISFVLGVRTAQLRGSLKELLFSNSEGTTAEDRPQRGYVRLVYKTDEGVNVTFARVIQPSGSDPDGPYQSVYKINDKTVSWENYSRELGSYGILVKVRNFLVFQGDIEAVAAKSPQGLTLLFEQISGSDAYKRRYDELEAEKTKAEEQMHIMGQKKKSVVLEKKQKKEQKVEAEKHMAKMQELQDLQLQYYLSQLYQVQQDMKEALQQRQSSEEELRRLEEEHNNYDEKINDCKKRQAGFMKEKMGLDKKVKKLIMNKDKKSPDVVKAREEMSRLTRRVKTLEKEVEVEQKKQEEQQTTVMRLQQDLEQLVKTRDALEAEAADVSGRQLSMSADALKQYVAIKDEVGTKTAKLQQEKDILVQAQRVDQDKLEQLEGAVGQMKIRLQTLDEQISHAQSMLTSTSASLAEQRALLAAKKKERGEVTDMKRSAQSKRASLQLKLDQLDQQVREAMAHYQQNQRDKKLTKIVTDLKAQIPGVYGFLRDMGRVTQRKYQLALSHAMGKSFDAVVVENYEAGKACINFLKQTRSGTMDFIPLDSVKVKPANEQLRRIGGTAKLAIDLIEFEPKFEPAFLYALGNCLVCDDVEEGKRLALRGAERHKVVTVDGTKMEKSGIIQGGSSTSTEQRASRWDDRAVEEKRTQMRQLEEEMAALPDPAAADEAERKLTGEVSLIENELQLRDVDMKRYQERLESLSSQKEATQREVDHQEPNIKNLEKDIGGRQKKIDQISRRINEVADRLFQDFSARVGVSNIREYEEQYVEAAEKLAKDKEETARQIARVETQLQYSKAKDNKKVIQEKEAAAEAARKHMEELRKGQEEAAGQLANLDEEVEKLKQEIEDVRAKAEAVETELAKVKQASSTHQHETGRLRRQMERMDAVLEQMTARQKEIMEAASLDQVVLPVLGETGGRAEGPSGGPSATPSSSGATPPVDMEVDFSSLKRAERTKMSVRDREARDKELKAKIDELQSSLEKTAPNMKAVEQYEAIKEKEKQQAAAFSAAQQGAQEVSTSFEMVRQKRQDTFMRAFTHISQAIDDIYKALTSSNQHPLGGTAYLSLENNEHPFLYGIKYTAMPPTKRFRDMDQLSGGEKTVAALALLFAIHSYRPSPFFVLDEVDAALDATNVSRVAHYIRSKTREDADNNFQSIVISLKDNFFEKADALVGVCRDGGHNCSKTFTFDLNKFDAPMDGM